MPKHLFLLEIQKAPGTPAVKLFTSSIHMYNTQITEDLPFFIRSLRIVTTDLTTARTVSIDLYDKGNTRLQIYDVTPNLDNNTIELSPYYKVEDGATGATTLATGVIDPRGYGCSPRAEIRFTWSDAISASDTSTWTILYEAYEKIDWLDTAAITTELRHLDLGRID